MIAALLLSLATQDVAALEAEAYAQVALPELERAELMVWRERVRPRGSELAWTEIPWLASFEAGIRAADAAARPLLFWAMNGHPLGCT